MKTLGELLCRIVAIAILLSIIVLAQNNPEAQRAAVVKLQIQRTDGAVETAAGLLVGKDQLNAYFITASHAVEQNDRGVEVRSVQIQFLIGTESFDAFVFEKYNRTLDLSVVRTALTNLPPGIPLVVRRNVAVGSSVRIIGHPLKVGWSLWQGSVQKEYGPNDEPHLFVTNLDKSLVGGYSGGPVLDSEGRFVGMHTRTDPGYGIATKSKDIIDQLVAWRIPTNNLGDVPESDQATSTATSSGPSARDNGFVFVLRGCSRQGQDVDCVVAVTNKDENRRMLQICCWAGPGGASTLLDDLGNEYRPRRMVLGAGSFAQQEWLEPDLPINMSVNFQAIDPKASSATLIMTYQFADNRGNRHSSRIVLRSIPLQQR